MAPLVRLTNVCDVGWPTITSNVRPWLLDQELHGQDQVQIEQIHSFVQGKCNQKAITVPLLTFIFPVWLPTIYLFELVMGRVTKCWVRILITSLFFKFGLDQVLKYFFGFWSGLGLTWQVRVGFQVSLNKYFSKNWPFLPFLLNFYALIFFKI